VNEIPKFADMKNATNGAAPPERAKRKYAKRAKADEPKKKRKYAKRAAKVLPTREYEIFLGEDDGIQLCRADGEGDSIFLTAADALAIAAFVQRHRAVIQS
jgi:hypothetical protein